MLEEQYRTALGDLVHDAPALADPAGVRRLLVLRTVPAAQLAAVATALGRSFPRAELTIVTANPIPGAPPAGHVVDYPFGRSFDRGRTPADWYGTLAGERGFDLVVIPYADDDAVGYENVRLFAAPLVRKACLELYGSGRASLTTADAFDRTLAADGAATTRPEVVGKPPHYVTLNLIEKCNLRCVMCDIPDGLAYDTMPFERVVEVAEALLPGCRHLTLNGFVGEPLLHPEFVRILDYVERRWPGIAAMLATNATPLRGVRMEAILASRILRELRISVNAVREDTYNAIMVRARWDRTMANIREFMHQRRERGVAGRLAAVFSFVAMRQNLDELPEFVAWAADLGADQVLVWDTMLSQDANADLAVADDRARTEAVYAAARRAAERGGIAITLPTPYVEEDAAGAAPTDVVTFRCNLPWTHAYVSPDGDVVPCCYYNRVMGNVFTEPFAAIWNGTRYRSLRAEIAAGEYPAPCIGCPQNFDGVKRRPQEVLHKSRRVEE
jgi:radical SAM protein with 4Fe4S-binding SPASM domain